ncbi:hypothetical protein CSA37_03715 [Candidatus Fermentibacteria bacterium]|nr:MAG: hypothetical protein CSA37_03715 [Candidatus Fermentibacteria bacterium]
MRVFLTGATGFIGSHLHRELLNSGHQVLTHSLSRDGKLTVIPETAEAVINSAGRLGKEGVTNEEMKEANLHLAKEICNHCRIRKIHLIHLSTPGAAGLVPDGRESDPMRPQGAYEQTKSNAEKYIMENLPSAVILRPDFVFGPGDMHKFSLFRQVSKGWFPLVNGGSARTRPTDVRDVCRAVLESLPEGKLGEGIWNVGGPDVLTVKELTEVIADVMKKKLIHLPVPYAVFKVALGMGPLKPAALSESRLRLFSSDRFTSVEKAAEAGFRAKYSFKETASECCAWYRERGLI